MIWTRLAGTVGVLGAVAIALGGLGALLLTDLLTGSFATAATVTLAVVIVSVVATVFVAQRTNRWVNNPNPYW